MREQSKNSNKNKEKIKILFVCTGNIFRSMSAEYCLKEYLKNNNINNFVVSSAGTGLIKSGPLPETINALKELKIDASKHRKTPVTKKLLEQQDFIIAMAKDHQHFIKKNFGLKSFLFNDVAIGEKTSVLDVSLRDINRKIKTNKTVNYINKNIPFVYEKLNDYFFLFENFLKNKKNHWNGFVPEILYESKHSVIFMALFIPEGVDSHLLVVPKKKYKYLEDVPIYILKDLMETIQIAGIALKKIYPAYNVLLNNGREANQYMFHVHFHVIPRRYGDDIIMEKWTNKKISEKEFKNLNKKYKRLLNA